MKIEKQIYLACIFGSFSVVHFLLLLHPSLGIEPLLLAILLDLPLPLCVAHRGEDLRELGTADGTITWHVHNEWNGMECGKMGWDGMEWGAIILIFI
jgi:hypothetical protein